MSRREPLITKPDSPEKEPAAPKRPRQGPARMGHGPMAQNVAEKAINFGPSLRRLMGSPAHRWRGRSPRIPKRTVAGSACHPSRRASSQTPKR